MFMPMPERTTAKGKIANGATAKVSPRVKRILNNKPPEASPKRLINVSMNTVDLYFSDFFSGFISGGFNN